MTADAEPHKRLGEYIERRIAMLGLEYAEVARLGDFSDETLAKIRKGQRARSSTYRGLERALRWSAGSIQAILAGGEPTPLDTDQEPTAAVDADWRLPAMREILKGVPLRDRPAVLRRLEELIEEEEAAERLQNSNAERPERNAM